MQSLSAPAGAQFRFRIKGYSMRLSQRFDHVLRRGRGHPFAQSADKPLGVHPAIRMGTVQVNCSAIMAAITLHQS